MFVMQCFHFQMCTYCYRKGASIGCCHKYCRKSFHFTCGVKNNCLTQFVDTYRSFCHDHHGIIRTNVHRPNELCSLCLKEMGPYHPITSICLPCCDATKWYHKVCLMKKALRMGSEFKCVLCGEIDMFSRSMLLNGIYIPDDGCVFF